VSFLPYLVNFLRRKYKITLIEKFEIKSFYKKKKNLFKNFFFVVSIMMTSSSTKKIKKYSEKKKEKDMIRPQSKANQQKEILMKIKCNLFVTFSTFKTKKNDQIWISK
jgi:hypothetical protein